MLVLAAALLFSFQAAAEGPAPGDDAPAFQMRPINSEQCGLTGPVSYNRFLNMEDAKRPKAYLVSFFASHCAACIKELPQIQQLYAENAGKGLMVIHITIDTEEAGIKMVKELLAKNKVTFPVLSDKGNMLMRRYGVGKLPHSLLLDDEARVVNVAVGYSEEQYNELVKGIGVLLSKAPSAPVTAEPVLAK
jgi:peroxiredoxin